MHFRLTDLVLLSLVLATAAGARVGYLVHYADGARNDGPVLVQDLSPELPLPAENPATEQDWLIQNFREHRWFGGLAPFAAAEERTAHVAPGYLWLRGELERLPFLPQGPDVLVRWFQCGLGTLTAGLYFLFSRRAFRSRTVALLSGLFYALYPFAIVSTAALTDAVLASFLLAACIWLGSRGGEGGGALTSLLYGLALAALALVRAALLPFAWVALLWYLWRCRGLAGGWLAALLASLGFLTGLAPWAVRNFEVFGDVFPVVDSTYFHLWMGNNPRATGGPQSEPEMIAALAEARGESRTAVLRDLGEAVGQPERYRALAQPMLDEVRRNPLGTLNRRLTAGLGFFLGEDWLTERRLWRDNPRVAPSESTRVSQEFYHVLLTGSLLATLLLAVLGWRWSFGWRREAMPLSLAAFWIPLPYLLSHAESLSGPRLPLDGVLLCYAAFAVSYVLPRVRARLLDRASAKVTNPR